MILDSYACTVLISLNNRDLVRRGENEEEMRVRRRRRSEQRSLIPTLGDRLRKMFSGQQRKLYEVDPFAVDGGLETESAFDDPLMLKSKVRWSCYIIRAI